MITLEQLIEIMPYGKTRAPKFIDGINATMEEFDINTRLRMAAFLAQIGHESGQLRYVKELASGSSYEGRADLGNTHPGDGVRYKGRGLIQITGRSNYVQIAKALNIDCVNNPELLEEPMNACRSAGWFWSSRKLNDLADKDMFTAITKKINGGTNGLADRKELYNKALEVLN